MAVRSIDHVQLAMPAGEEDRTRRFYEGLLGLPERPKLPDLARRGGVWFETAAVKIHLGVEQEFRPARAAAGYRRVYVDDPFGNRLELMEPAS